MSVYKQIDIIESYQYISKGKIGRYVYTLYNNI